MPFSPMSWHLVYSLIKLLDASGDSLHKRMNIISEIIGDIAAKKNKMKREKETAEVKELEERINILISDFLILRGGYQPTIENASYIYGKMGYYEMAYDCISNEIKNLIEEFNLLDKDQIKEIPLPGAAYDRVNRGSV
jgi:hypothetical protein